MKKMLISFILGGIIFGTIGVVAATTISSNNVTYQNKTVNNALDELYNEATTGKEVIAAAITNKGVSTTSGDTYETMATNINNIHTDHTEINQKISSLESKHNTDIASLTGSISSVKNDLSYLRNIVDVEYSASHTFKQLASEIFNHNKGANGFFSGVLFHGYACGYYGFIVPCLSDYCGTVTISCYNQGIPGITSYSLYNGIVYE